MATDTGAPSPRRDERDLWWLPEILEVRSRIRRFDRPTRLTIKGEDRLLETAIEIGIVVSEPFPIRALGPALWVGDEPLTIAESDGARYYGFLAPDPKVLRPGAPISLSWNSPGATRSKPLFRYEPPD